jgi:hypothetical protein
LVFFAGLSILSFVTPIIFKIETSPLQAKFF